MDFVSYNSGRNRAQNFKSALRLADLKLLPWLLLDLYSTWSNYYYLFHLVEVGQYPKHQAGNLFYGGNLTIGNSTCFMPNFLCLTSLPKYCSTLVSLQTKPFIWNIFLSSPRNHLLSLAVTFPQMTNIL